MKKQFELLKKEIKYLSFSRKLILFGSIFSALFLVFPWGTFGVPNEGSPGYGAENFSAFEIFPIFGWLLLLLSLLSLGFLLREIATKKTMFKSLSHSLSWSIIGGIGIYTILIALFVFNSGYFKKMDSYFSLKFGIFLVLFMECLIFFGGFIGMKDESKDYIRESLSRPQGVDTSRAHLAPEPPRDQMSLGDYDR